MYFSYKHYFSHLDAFSRSYLVSTQHKVSHPLFSPLYCSCLRWSCLHVGLLQFPEAQTSLSLFSFSFVCLCLCPDKQAEPPLAEQCSQQRFTRRASRLTLTKHKEPLQGSESRRRKSVFISSFSISNIYNMSLNKVLIHSFSHTSICFQHAV